MRPDEGKIFIVDDEKLVVDNLNSRLKQAGYETMGVNNRQDALDAIPILGDCGIKLAILDGNLGPIKPGNTPHDDKKYGGNHGQEIFDLIRQTYGDGIKAIGVSSMYTLRGAEAMVCKTNINAIIAAVKKTVI